MAISSQTGERRMVRPVRAAPRRSMKLTSDRLAAIAFGLPAAVLLAVVVVCPLINDVRLSLQHISPGVDEPFVGLRNYKAVLADRGQAGHDHPGHRTTGPRRAALADPPGPSPSRRCGFG